MSEVTGLNKEFSTSQIAKALDVSTRTIYRWIEDGEIEYSRTVTGRYRFPESELRRILEERKRKGLDKISEVILKTVKKKKDCLFERASNYFGRHFFARICNR